MNGKERTKKSIKKLFKKNEIIYHREEMVKVKFIDDEEVSIINERSVKTKPLQKTEQESNKQKKQENKTYSGSRREVPNAHLVDRKRNIKEKKKIKVKEVEEIQKYS
ncbi:uncharacterized protein LOC129223993 [Uloborus diversus]|uniref:uncharacterized protein LOC129223993 n=1 Tax=Uloborus diversus TaxID=327109 RepID=UPI002409139C|nr:uncharacterized protein LOC129223993 [Uloborus diversus]